jgi:predicted secreted acid phosphatase
MKIRVFGLAALALIDVCGCADKPLALVVDIDSTITDSHYRRRIARKVPLAGAAEVISREEKEGLAVIYLSKRQARYRSTTVWWLEQNGFPRGAKVIHRTDPSEPGLDFKSREIAGLKKDFDIVCAIGNEDDDRLAYDRAGLFAITHSHWSDEEWAAAEKVLDGIVRSRKGTEETEKE